MIYANVYDELVVGGAALAERGELTALLIEDYPIVLDVIDAIERRGREPNAMYEMVFERVLPILRRPAILDGLRGLLRELRVEVDQP